MIVFVCRFSTAKVEKKGFRKVDKSTNKVDKTKKYVLYSPLSTILTHYLSTAASSTA